MPIIYVVRHGETDMNLNEKINDKNIQATINKTGIKQAKKTGMYFKNRKLSKSNCIIYSSPSISICPPTVTVSILEKVLKILYSKL